MVDNRKMALNPAVSISYLDKKQQRLLYKVMVALKAKEHHSGTQHQAVPARGAVQCAYHHEQSLHFIGQPRYARRRLVIGRFCITPKEAQHESD